MKKNKKLLLALGTITSVAAPIAAVVSCGSNEAIKVGRNELVYMSSPQDHPIEGTGWLDPQSGGTSNEDITSNTASGLGLLTTSGKYVIDASGKFTSKASNAAKLQLATKVSLSKDGGSVTDITADELNDKIYGSTKTVAKFNEITFALGDTEWQTSASKGNGHKLQAKDFAYALVRRLLQSRELRGTGITNTSKQLGDATKGIAFAKAVAKLTGVTAPATTDAAGLANWYKTVWGKVVATDGSSTETKYYQNIDSTSAYLMDLLDIDIVGTLNANTTEGQKNFVLKLSTDKTDLSILKRVFLGGTLESFFAPVDSKFYDEKTKLGDKLGFYTYGTNPANTAFIGKYIAQKYSPVSDQVFVKNKNFIDSKWADDDTTSINKITVLIKTTDASIAATTYTSMFNQGLISVVPTTKLTTAEKNAFYIAHPDDVSYSTPSTVGSGLFQRQDYWAPVLSPGAAKNQDPDLLALIGEDKTASGASNFFSDNAIKFRKDIRNAVNVVKFAKQFGAEKVPYRGIVASGYSIDNKVLNELPDSENEGFTRPTGTATIKAEEAQTHAATSKEQWESSKFKKYQNEIKGILDNYFTDTNLKTNSAHDPHKLYDGKVKINLLPGGGLTSKAGQEAYKEYATVLQDLDPRLEANPITIASNDEFHASYYPVFLQAFGSWGADFPEANSGLTGWLYNGDMGITILKQYAKFDSTTNNFSEDPTNSVPNSIKKTFSQVIAYANSLDSTTKSTLATSAFKDIQKDLYEFDGTVDGFNDLKLNAPSGAVKAAFNKFNSGIAKAMFDLEHSGDTTAFKDVLKELTDLNLISQTSYGFGASVVTDKDAALKSIIKGAGTFLDVRPISTDSDSIGVWGEYVVTPEPTPKTTKA